VATWVPALSCYSSWPVMSESLTSACLAVALLVCGTISHRHMMENPLYTHVQPVHFTFIVILFLMIVTSAIATHVMATAPSQKADSKHVRDHIRNREFKQRVLPLLLVLTMVSWLFFFTSARQCATIMTS
jgi:small-conductance mechanosensitive channel